MLQHGRSQCHGCCTGRSWVCYAMHWPLEVSLGFCKLGGKVCSNCSGKFSEHFSTSESSVIGNFDPLWGQVQITFSSTEQCNLPPSISFSPCRVILIHRWVFTPSEGWLRTDVKMPGLRPSPEVPEPSSFAPSSTLSPQSRWLTELSCAFIPRPRGCGALLGPAWSFVPVSSLWRGETRQSNLPGHRKKGR